MLPLSNQSWLLCCHHHPNPNFFVATTILTLTSSLQSPTQSLLLCCHHQTNLDFFVAITIPILHSLLPSPSHTNFIVAITISILITKILAIIVIVQGSLAGGDGTQSRPLEINWESLFGGKLQIFSLFLHQQGLFRMVSVGCEK